MTAFPEVRPSPIAGLWYSANPQDLASQVDEFLGAAAVEPLAGRIIALVSPHAGLRYSGRTAAHAFATIAGQSFSTVAVISPLHDYHPAAYLTTAHAAYATPLGRIDVDHHALSLLDQQLKIARRPPVERVPSDQEHSLEMELPFLQRALRGDFRLLPLMVRTHNPGVLVDLGSALATVLAGQSALIVASTDLSHFYPQRAAQRFDHAMLQAFVTLDPEHILDVQQAREGFACGAAAVAVAVTAAARLGANAAQVLHQSTSADETGDTSAVVGYGAVAIFQREQA